MDIVSPIIDPIIEIVMVPVKKELGYLFSCTKHVRNMKTRMEQLDNISRDVKRRMDRNKMSNLEIPTGVPGWLTDVENTKKDADSISSTGCLNINMRYRAGRKAFKTTEDIDRLIKTNSEMIWDDAKKFPAEENSNNGSTSAPAYEDAQNHFKSNEKAFNDTLGFLQPDHKSQVIALHGMGGVGKSKMMEQLKKTLKDRKAYELFVKVLIGETGELFNIQRSLAEYLSLSLTEMDPTIRAKRLGIAFTNLPEGKRKVLVILDDVWKTIKLDDIGLKPLPKGFKLLLTSRYKNTCRQIATEANFDLKLVEVELMKEPEAQDLFWQIVGDENEKDRELNRIGTEIVRECGFLPLAINIVAGHLCLRSEETESVWNDTLERLKNNELEEKVQQSIKISYDYIKKEEEKAIFLLCGLLQIRDCENMDVIVKQVEDSETRLTEVEFPCLKSITLNKLPHLKGFCLGKEAFVLPSLDTLEIKDCPEITVFTGGQSTTPKLKLIDATFGLCDATEDPNSFIKTKQQEGWEF